MRNEHTFGLFGEPDTAAGEPAHGADRRIAAALRELEQARIRPISRHDADRVLGMLSRIRTVAASLMCDIAEMAVTTHPETDSAEVLRQGARIPTRESKRMTKIAKHLTDMPNVKDRFAAGEITTGHVNALANAAEKVGPETVNTDEALLQDAEDMLPDNFDRHTRKWTGRKLIEQGLNPLERQRQMREAKLWVEKDTGLGVLMAKLPRPQFEQPSQAVDNHYLHHLRQDGAGGRQPDEVRTPKQRVADVVFELLTGRSAFSGKFITDQVDVKAKSSTQLIITAPVGTVDGADPQEHVEMIGVGPVPRRILRTLTPDTELAGMIFDRPDGPSGWVATSGWATPPSASPSR